MPANPSSPEIPLPRGWPSRIKSAILHVISLGRFTLAYTRGWAANSPNSRIRLKAKFRNPDTDGSGSDGLGSLDGQSETQVGAGKQDAQSVELLA